MFHGENSRSDSSLDTEFETTEDWEDKCFLEFMKITHELQSSFLKVLVFPPELYPRYNKIPEIFEMHLGFSAPTCLSLFHWKLVIIFE